MHSSSLINLDPSPRQLRVFGLAWLVFFALAGIVALGRGGPVMAAALGVTAVLAPAVGLLSPRLLRILYLGMAYLALPIGLALSCLLLATTYYFVLTAIGFFMRAVGHDPLKRSDKARADSYWVPRKADESLDRYFRQF